MKSNYINQFTFLRFLAAALVVVFHFGGQTKPFDSSMLSPFISQGSIAVSFFFFLSGVVLTVSYYNKPVLKTGSFLLKRLARIYPVYLLAFGVTLMLGMLYNNAYPKGLSIILQALSLHAWNPGSCLEINFPSWSISVEMFFYILFPFILRPFKRLNLTNATLFILAIWILSAVQHYFSKQVYDPSNPAIGQFTLYFPFWHLNTFMFGMFCGRFIDNFRIPTISNQWPFRVLYILGIAAFLLILSTDNPIKTYTHNGLMSPVFFVILIGLAADRSIFSRILGSKPLVALGNASYSMYILQWPVFIVFRELLGQEHLVGTDFYLYFTGLVAVSVLTYQLFERKAQQLILDKWL
ncbi:MAG: acyltransferase [Flavobacteriales bacterium]|nr:acyltransferase [Flavobacteriales bacterium]